MDVTLPMESKATYSLFDELAIATRLRGSVAATISLDGPAQTSYINELT